MARLKKVTVAKRAMTSSSPPAFNKIARPQPDAPYPRVRLFSLLDAAREKRVIWLSAPAGSGKTTLAASYLESNRLRYLWYRLDSRDADPASFFYFLRLAVQKAAPRKVETLPLLTPEYYLDLPVFARGFFEETVRRIKAPAVIVLDDYQDVPEGSHLHALLVESVAVLPPEFSLLVVSRAAPPPEYARLRAHGEMAALGWDDIRFTPDELSGFAHTQRSSAATAPDLARMYERTLGWAAGIMLMMEAGGDTSCDPLHSTGQETLFHYFTTEIFRRADPAIQDFLLKSALLPEMTPASAEAITGNARAEHILSDLARRQFFTLRLSGPGLIYRYHPLFREYLLHEGRTRFAPAQQSALKRVAATILADAGAYEDAADLMRDSADGGGLVSLILRHAPELVGQGRFAMLEQWLNSLPASDIATNPWLAHWSAVCRLPAEPIAARALFQRGYEKFRAAGDAAGAYLCWAGIADSFIFMWDDLTELRTWLAEFDALQRDHPHFPAPEIEVRVTASVFGAMAYAQLQHPRIAHWLGRAEALFYSDIDPNYRIQLAGYLGLYFFARGRGEDARRVTRVVDRIAHQKSVTPLSRISASCVQALMLSSGAEPESAERIAREAFEIAETSGVRILDIFALSQIVYARGMMGDLAGVSEGLERIRERLVPTRRLDVGHFLSLQGWYESLRGNYALAITYMRESRELSIRLAAQFPIVMCNVDLAQALALSGALDEAENVIEEAAAQAQEIGSDYMAVVCGMLRAYMALRRGRFTAAAELLRATFSAAVQNGNWYVRVQPALLKSLCLFAVRQRIEPDFALRVVRRIMTPDSAPVELEYWPWPVKVQAFGRFTVLLDGEPLVFEGKAQKKALELLKALVAFGGRDVPVGQLADLLWPESEAARANLKSTLHRLRKLTGADVLKLSDDRLTLDPRRSWVDVLAFEQTLDAAGNDSESLRLALPLYKGEFMTGDEEAYVLRPRERLKRRFLRAVLRVGASLECAGRWDEASEWYESALAVEELAEPLYQGLMRCFGQLKRPADAVAVYARCARNLESAFGVAPSPETQALRNTLFAQQDG